MSGQQHKTKEYLDDEELWRRREEQKKLERERYERNELESYGVVTYSRQPSGYRSDVIVIPIEIEVPSEIDAFTKAEILNGYNRSYKKWIQECSLHRMREILTNPTEFGKVVLKEKKSDHCIQEEDLEDLEDY
jgi:hypothetical protein